MGMDESQYNRIRIYEDTYRRIFKLLRGAGWTPEKQSRQTPDGFVSWVAVRGAWGLHSLSLDFADELEMRVICRPPREVRFAPGQVFEKMTEAIYQGTDVRMFLGDDAAPVAEFEHSAEGNDYVLFVCDDHRSGLMSRALDRFVFADDPFALMDWYLFEDSEVEVMILESKDGGRITQQADLSGQIRFMQTRKVERAIPT